MGKCIKFTLLKKILEKKATIMTLLMLKNIFNAKILKRDYKDFFCFSLCYAIIARHTSEHENGISFALWHPVPLFFLFFCFCVRRR